MEKKERNEEETGSCWLDAQAQTENVDLEREREALITPKPQRQLLNWAVTKTGSQPTLMFNFDW
jgi:hypothetical protein